MHVCSCLLRHVIDTHNLHQTKVLSLVITTYSRASAMNKGTNKPPLGAILLNRPTRLISSSVIDDKRQSIQPEPGDEASINAKTEMSRTDECINKNFSETPYSITTYISEDAETSAPVNTSLRYGTKLCNLNQTECDTEPAKHLVHPLSTTYTRDNDSPQVKASIKKRTVLPKDLLANVTYLVKQQRSKLPELHLKTPKEHRTDHVLMETDHGVFDTTKECITEQSVINSQSLHTSDGGECCSKAQQIQMEICTDVSEAGDCEREENASKDVNNSTKEMLDESITEACESEGNANKNTRSIPAIDNTKEVLNQLEGKTVNDPDRGQCDFIEETTKSKTLDDTHDSVTGLVQKSLPDTELLLPDLFEDCETQELKAEEVYDISPLFTGELDRRYKSEKKKAIKQKGRKPKQKKKRDQGLENGEGEGDGDKTEEKTSAPNYFIAIQITNKQIHDALQLVQQEVLTGNQLLSSAMIKLTKLHLTMFVLRLDTEDDMTRSRLALENAIDKIRKNFSNKTLKLDICGLGNFRNEIVFAKIKDEQQVDELKTIADLVEDSFLEQGLVSTEKRGFKPHITVMKLSKAKHLRRKGIKKIEEKLYEKFKSMEFGVEEVKTLQLCAMMKTGPTGYYHVEHSGYLTSVEKKKAIKQKGRKPKQKKKRDQGLENGEGEGDGDKTEEKTSAPNYFIAIQITNKQIHDALQLVQQEVLTGNQLLSSAMIKLTKLHLTMFVLRLDTEDDMTRSRLALENAIDKIRKNFSNKTLKLDICGLGNFRNEIVFAKIKDEQQVDELKTIADLVEDSFLEQGLVSTEKRGFKPHITVMKLSKAKHLRRKGIKKIEEKLYEKFKSMEFGVEEVKTLQLCAMMKTGPTGYYHVEHSGYLTSESTTRSDAENVSANLDESQASSNDDSNTTTTEPPQMNNGARTHSYHTVKIDDNVNE